jgi:hypothetical protein
MAPDARDDRHLWSGGRDPRLYALMDSIDSGPQNGVAVCSCPQQQDAMVATHELECLARPEHASTVGQRLDQSVFDS